MGWKPLLAEVTGSVDEELLFRNEHLAADMDWRARRAGERSRDARGISSIAGFHPWRMVAELRAMKSVMS